MKLRVRLSAASPLALLLALLPLTGCPGGQEEGEEEVGQTSDTTSSDTGSESGSGTQGETDSTGSTDSTGDSTTADPGDSSGTSDTTAGDTTDSTTGEIPPGVEEACMAACEVYTTCLEPFPECVASCVESHLGLDAMCLDAELALTNCIAGLTCAEVLQLVNDEPNPCQEEAAAVCDGPICEAGVGIGENPGECSFDYTCPEQPVYEVMCDGSSCICLEDGVEVGGCSDAASFCATDDYNAAANDCCGWSI